MLADHAKWKETGIAASYARKSTPDDPGLKSQHLINAQKAREDGVLIPEGREFRFEDDETSGRATAREDLDRLVSLVTSGEAPFDRVYIKDKTREGRFADPRFHFYLQVQFEKHGVRIAYSDRDVQLDFSKGMTQDMFGLYLKDVLDGLMSSEELTRLIDRVTTGMRIWVMRGFYPGAQAPYGIERWYADEQTGAFLDPVDENAVVRRKGQRFKLRSRRDETRQVVKEIFDRLEAGESMTSVASRLTARGVESPGGLDRWNKEAVRKIAGNPLYHGVLVWGRTTRDLEPVPASEAQPRGEAPILVEEFVDDPPITKDQFDRVGKVLERNRTRWDRRRRSAPAYPLSGLLECKICRGGWSGHTRPSGLRYYTHQRSHAEFEGRCPNRYRNIHAEAVEEVVEAIFADLLQDPEVQDRTAEAVAELVGQINSDDTKEEVARLEAELARLRAGVEQLVEDRALAATQLEREACQQRLGRLTGRATELERQITNLRQTEDHASDLSAQQEALQSALVELPHILASADPERRKQAYREVVRRIIVHEDLQELTLEVSRL